jgi:hypothetical protein
MRGIANGSSFAINALDNVLITWIKTIPPALPFTFILGMVGLFAIFVGPAYGIYKIQRKDYYEGATTALIITVVGIALFIAWLWG